ncbi:zinc-ribbon domain-containing protein [Stieleria sp. ICT_E10.1]|uniref:zinc-ribbon domain-containing protein n=1 Tax=Stieleria sedimenti TaxID=2976331 RepID=UPI0021805676|nr:zinc-ribbon domain-containing protein [Stieleria sedimenti]MCS7470536.1 zinc-ribbon domain-containing protein [Stieleria sedimenti]
MSSFQQSCPSCNASLELPIAADGKAAVCPACQARFIAAAPTVLESSPTAVVTPQLTPQPVAVKRYRKIPIEHIFADTQSVFIERRRPLLMPFLIPSVLVVLGLLLPLAVLSDMASTNLKQALLWLAIASPWFLLVTVYSVWFALNLSLDVCDAGPDLEDDPPPKTRSWFVPKAAEFISLLIAMTIAITCVAVVIGLAIVIMNVGSNVQATEIHLLMTVGAFVGAILLLTLSAMRLWPVIPLAMDGRFGGAVVRESLEMTKSNLMTSFFLVVGVFFLVGFGFSVFGLGLPLAIPVAALALVVALRLIQGRGIPAFDREEL